MSGEVLFDVMNCDGFGKPAMKLLMVALADRADETGVCWPSRGDLALRTGLSQSSITRTARALESAGWIQRKQRHDAATVYRLNVLKLAERAAECKRARKLRRVGADWPKFPEEMAQAIENKGDGHTDPGSGQSDPGSGHTDHLTSQEPLKNLRRAAKACAAPERRRSPHESGDGAPAVKLGDLSEFQRSRLLAGSDVLVKGELVRAGSATAERLARSIRLERDARSDAQAERRAVA